MEIKFIWVEEYRNIIQKLNINLYHQGAHQFHYENGRLELLLNEPSLLDFGPKVSGVTAIAGQNGSGKSSICEVILNAAATLVNGGFNFAFPYTGILVYGNYIFPSKQIPLDNIEELVAAGYQVIPFSDTPLGNLPHDLKPEFIKRGFIYYSNMLDVFDLPVDIPAVKNIKAFTIYRQCRKMEHLIFRLRHIRGLLEILGKLALPGWRRYRKFIFAHGLN